MECSGAESFVLVRSTEEPRKSLFEGVAELSGAGAVARDAPVRALLGQCRELCEEFETHFHTLAAGPIR
jgi:hypothetical protein